MEFEWLISSPEEIMEIFENVESHGKKEINHNKNDILARHEIWYSW